MIEMHRDSEIFCQYCSFFLRGGSPLRPQTQAYWTIALYLSFKFIHKGLFTNPSPQGPRSCSVSPFLFVPDPSWQSSRSASLAFPTPGIRIECVPMFPFLHLMHEGVFALLILCSMYCRLIRPVRSPTNILQKLF